MQLQKRMRKFFSDLEGLEDIRGKSQRESVRVSGTDYIYTRLLVYTQSITRRILRELIILIPGSGGWCWVA